MTDFFVTVFLSIATVAMFVWLIVQAIPLPPVDDHADWTFVERGF